MSFYDENRQDVLPDFHQPSSGWPAVILSQREIHSQGLACHSGFIFVYKHPGPKPNKHLSSQPLQHLRPTQHRAVMMMTVTPEEMYMAGQSHSNVSGVSGWEASEKEIETYLTNQISKSSQEFEVFFLPFLQ